mgnify:CR=1 FL=1
MTERTLVRYRPAATGWWVAAENGAVAVLAPAVSAGTATAVWRKVGGGGIGAVIEALTGAFGTSLSAIPPFGLAVAEAGGVRLTATDLDVSVQCLVAAEVAEEGGTTLPARRAHSLPATTGRPRSFAASMTPNAIASLAAKMAVKRWPDASRRSTACRPPAATWGSSPADASRWRTPTATPCTTTRTWACRRDALTLST